VEKEENIEREREIEKGKEKIERGKRGGERE